MTTTTEMRKMGRKWVAPESAFVSRFRERYVEKCVPLHKAALTGNWEAARVLLDEDDTLTTAPVTERGETALHIAAVEGHAHFVASLLQRMDKTHLQITNEKGCTALTFAAAAGHVGIAKMMVNKHPGIPTVTGTHGGLTPLFMAALIGRVDVAHYLFYQSNFEHWTQQDQIALLNASIQSGIYDLAMGIVSKNKNLAFVADANGETPLAVLARNSSAFGGNRKPRPFQIVSSKGLLKKRNDKMAVACDAHALFNLLWDIMITHQDIENGEIYDYNTCSLVFIAAESGNYHFLVELIRRDPVFLYKVNHSSHSIFHIAASNRHVEIFNLIYEMIGMKDLMTTYIDQDTGNNMLHLAAKIAPQHQLIDIHGAALQMQREVLWYKEVEKIVQPLYRNMKNNIGKTPHELFLEQHGSLMKEGEKEVKHIAKSFLLVTMLITMVVYAASLMVHRGSDNSTGPPIQGNRTKVFAIFPICEGVVTLSLLASMLMFLSITTSRYKKKDFLTTLPFWLVNGMMAVFVAIVAMVGAMFSLIMFSENGLEARVALMVLFGSVPMMFVAIKYELMVGILRCTYDNRWLFGSNNCLFS